MKLLNEICYRCYSNEEYGASARSLNIDDIENVLKKKIWEPANYRRNNLDVYLGGREYITNMYYPYIYSIEDNSCIDNVKVEEGKRNW